MSTRLKNAFSVHGRTRTPRREARLISETLRNPKPHTVEEQEQMRASVTKGGQCDADSDLGTWRSGSPSGNVWGLHLLLGKPQKGHAKVAI